MKAHPTQQLPKIVQRCDHCRSEIVLRKGLTLEPTIACGGCGREVMSPVARLLFKR